jgi:hypothetical protein
MFEPLTLIAATFLVLFVILMAVLFALTCEKISRHLDPHLHDLFDDGEPNNVSNQEDTTKKTV